MNCIFVSDCPEEKELYKVASPSTNSTDKCDKDTEAIYQECLSTLPRVDGDACIECVNPILTNAGAVLDCNTYVNDFCPAFLQYTACGQCLDSISDWLTAKSEVPPATLIV